MCPSGISLEYLMADLLLEYMTKGCMVDCREDWSLEKIQVAIDRGSHIRKHEIEASKYAWTEARDKERKCYYSIYKWSDIKESYPKSSRYHQLQRYRINQDHFTLYKIYCINLQYIESNTYR